MTARSAIRTIEDLKARCRVDASTGCWVWAGCYSERGDAVLWLPKIGKASITLALHQVLGLPKPTHKALLMPTCGSFACANPAHRRMGTKGEFLQGKHARRAAPEMPVEIPEYPAWMGGSAMTAMRTGQ